MSQELIINQNRLFTCEITIENNESYYALKTGERLVFGIKASPMDDGYIIKKEIDRTAVASDGIGYMLELSTEETDIDAGKYYYDIALRTSLGELLTIVDSSVLTVECSIVRSDADD